MYGRAQNYLLESAIEMYQKACEEIESQYKEIRRLKKETGRLKGQAKQLRQGALPCYPQIKWRKNERLYVC